MIGDKIIEWVLRPKEGNKRINRYIILNLGCIVIAIIIIIGLNYIW